MNWLDLQQAINDITLQLIVTIIFLIVLSIVGVYFARRSRRKQHPKYAPMNHKIWLRIQRGDYQHKQPNSGWWADFWQGISTEFFGAVVTTSLLGIGVLIFTQYQVVQNRKVELVVQVGSGDKDFASEAIRLLRLEGWLDVGILQGAELNGADLSTVDLSGIDLSYANLVDANFSRDVNFSNPNLKGTNLSFADLRGANFTNADLTRTNLSFADLRGANFTNAKLISVNFRGAKLDNVDFSNIHIIYSDFSNAELTGAIFVSSELQGCTLEGANLMGANLSSYANLTNTNLSNADLSRADLHYAMLERANLEGANLSSADLGGANFTDANLTGAELKDAIWQLSNRITDRNRRRYSETIIAVAILPDGTEWEYGIDLGRFTNQEHSEYWNPCSEVQGLIKPMYCY